MYFNVVSELKGEYGLATPHTRPKLRSFITFPLFQLGFKAHFKHN